MGYRQMINNEWFKNKNTIVVPRCVVCKSEIMSYQHKFCSEECFQFYMGNMIGQTINDVVYPREK